MSRHVTKSDKVTKSSLCLLCCRPVVYSFGPCPINAELAQFLCDYAKKNGPRWKSLIRSEWDSTNDTNTRRVRNILGDRGLGKIKIADLERRLAAGEEGAWL